MKKLVLKDRVVVEFLASENEERFTPDFIAGQLRNIADEIQNGRSGDNYIPWDYNEVIWEHESVGYGGFRLLSDKSLISQFIYHSEPQPLIISRETYDKVEQWDRDCEEKDDADDLRYTDGDMCEKAQDIVSNIIKECKPLLK